VCLRADWDGGHKDQCKKLAGERAAAEESAKGAKEGEVVGDNGGGGGGGGGGKSSADAPLQLGEEQAPPIAHIPTGLDCRVTCWACAGCGQAQDSWRPQDPKGTSGCSGCNSVVYCKKVLPNYTLEGAQDKVLGGY
jgi:hypothetical protein